MIIAATDEITYPDGDGKPMADNTLQFEWIVTLKENIDAMFQNDPRVFVAGDLLWYPVQGNNKLRAAPDTMVAFGRPKGYRGSYRQWEEDDIPPKVVFEVLSPGNRPGEMARKRDFYDTHGVDEYYVIDPENPNLEVWIRKRGTLQLVTFEGTWTSPRLSIRLELHDDGLAVFRPDGMRFRTFQELNKQHADAEQRADAEARRADNAEARAEELEARLRALGETLD